MKDIKVSVLVPIYNVERYLRECLRTLERQTLQEMEFICVNDGSTDHSLDILQRFARRDKRFKVIDKENSGYGDSMNLALTQACGEYVGIVEPDDYVELDTFADLYYLAVKERADVVRANYYQFSETGSQVFQQISEREAAGQVKNSRDDFVDSACTGTKCKTRRCLSAGFHCLRQPPAIWSGLYKRTFLERNQIQFLTTPGASYQDTGFFWKTLASAKKITFTGRAYYHYRTDNANSSVKNSAKVDMVRQEYHAIEEYLQGHDLLTTFGGVMQATKFATYYWNLLRLDRQFVKDFAVKMREEFQLAWANDALDKRYFSRKHWWVLQLLLHARPLFWLQVNLYRGLKNRT